jgi:hypothetical protein
MLAADGRFRGKAEVQGRGGLGRLVQFDPKPTWVAALRSVAHLVISLLRSNSVLSDRSGH